MSNQSELINELALALSKAQGEIGPVAKNKKNAHLKSEYADLNAFIEASRQAISKNGLAVVQTFGQTERGLEVVTTLMHSSGQWIKSSLVLKAEKESLHGAGSLITYCRKYSYAAILNIAPGEVDLDDDGNDAVHLGSTVETKPTYTKSIPTVEKPLKKIEISSKEAVDTLLSLISKCPEEMQNNFNNRVREEFGDCYKMTVSYCETATQHALNKMKKV